MRFSVERWRPILGYEGFYEISDRGRIRALFKAGNFHKPGRILKPWLLKNGYLQVHLMRSGQRRKAFCVHRLLLEAFTGKHSENKEARHLNCNRSDNSLSNLAWGTHKENMQDSVALGRMAAGERQGASKLTNSAVLKIRYLWEQEVPASEIAVQFNIDRSNVWQIATRKTWRHV